MKRGCSGRCSSCRPRASTPRASATAGARCTPASTWPLRSGRPSCAASDGVVVDAGPTAGYGAWVKIRHSDGTVTLYGHVNTWTVQIGQRVFAGDQIATVGNRGNSTGPHLHFEVLLNGTNRIDPVPWLAQRGLSGRPLRRLTRCLSRTTRTPASSGASRPDRSPSPRSPAPASSGGHPPGRSLRRPIDRTVNIPRPPADEAPTGLIRRATPVAVPARAGAVDVSTGRTAIAASAVSIISGWATGVVATDLITGWWGTDRLFCVAVGFLTLLFAVTTIAGVIALLLRRSVGRYLIAFGAVIALLTFGSVFVAGARIPLAVYLIPVLPVAAWSSPCSRQLVGGAGCGERRRLCHHAPRRADNPDRPRRTEKRPRRRRH